MVLWVQHYGLPAIFTSNFIENIGIPLPIEAAYIAGQTLITSHRYSYITILIIISLGQITGAVLSYYLGKRVAEKYMTGENQLSSIQKKIHNWYQKHGPATVFICRLVGYVRPWSSFVAGIAEINFSMFLIFTILGTLVLNIVALAITDYVVYAWINFEELRIVIALSFSIGIIYMIAHGTHSYIKKRKGNKD